MTPISVVAVVLATAVLTYFISTAVASFVHPDLITTERSRIWSELMAVLVGGLVAFISRGDR